MTSTTVHIAMDGLVAVHAARAAHTALGSVPGLLTAEVTLAGATVEIAGGYEPASFATAVAAALAPVGLTVRAITVVQRRQLPLA